MIQRLKFLLFFFIPFLAGGAMASTDWDGHSFQQCLEDLCGSRDEFVSLKTRQLRSERALQSADLSTLERTFWGQAISQKIDAYYNWYKATDISQKETLVKQTLREIIERPLEHTNILPTRGPIGFFIAREGHQMIVDWQDNLNIGLDGRQRHRELALTVKDMADSPRLSGLEHYSAEKFLRARYGNLSLREATLRYIDDAERLLVRDRKNTSGLFYQSLELPDNLRELRDKAQNRQLTSQELDYLVQSARNLSILEIVLDYQDRYSREITWELRQKLLSWSRHKTQSQRAALIHQIEGQVFGNRMERLSREQQLAKEKCLVAFSQNYFYYPAQSEIDRLKDFVFRAREDFVEKIQASPGLSEKAKDVMALEIEKIFFKFPFSRETYRSLFMQLLDSKLARERESHSIIFSEDAQSLSLSLLIMAMNGRFQENTESGNSDIAEFCTNSLQQDLIGDHIHYALNAIKVSYGLILGPPSYARQVLYHEIGHQLGQILVRERGIDSRTYGQFRETEACLSDRQARVGGRPSFYLSEDFADLMATLANSDEEDTSMPFACQFFYQDSTGLFWQPSLINTDEEDNHSSYLLRILNSHVDQGGELPRSCQSALHEKTDIARFEDYRCLPLGQIR